MPEIGEKRLPARQRWTRARHRPGTCKEHCQELHGKGWRVRVAPPERDPRGSGQHCFKELGRQRSCSAKDTRAAPLEDAQMAASELVRVAPPGSTVWTSAGSTAREATPRRGVDSPDEAGPSYRSCTVPVHNDGGVSGYQAY